MPIVIDYDVNKRPIYVQTIVDRAGLLLNDVEHVRWTTIEIIDWINEAAGAIVSMKPAAGAKIIAMPLLPGSRQEIPDDVVQLIDVIRNLGADGVTPGRSIRMTERHLLDSADPDWHTRPGKNSIRHYTYDDRTPAIFYVYPPAIQNVRVQVAYSKMPEEVDSVTDFIDINIEYADALLNHVMYRCLAKDSEFASAQMATGYYQAFLSSMGQNVGGEQATTPTNKAPA